MERPVWVRSLGGIPAAVAEQRGGRPWVLLRGALPQMTLGGRWRPIEADEDRQRPIELNEAQARPWPGVALCGSDLNPPHPRGTRRSASAPMPGA